MKKVMTLFVLSAAMMACSNKNDTGQFLLSGSIKNVPDQQVYLEQLFFTQQEPQVLDTGEIKAGKFTVSGIAAEEGLYRLRFEKDNSGCMICMS